MDEEAVFAIYPDQGYDLQQPAAVQVPTDFRLFKVPITV